MAPGPSAQSCTIPQKKHKVRTREIAKAERVQNWTARGMDPGSLWGTWSAMSSRIWLNLSCSQAEAAHSSITTQRSSMLLARPRRLAMICLYRWTLTTKSSVSSRALPSHNLSTFMEDRWKVNELVAYNQRATTATKRASRQFARLE